MAAAARYHINAETVAKWRKRTTVEDARMGANTPRSTVLTAEREAMIVAFRRQPPPPPPPLLPPPPPPPGDCLSALRSNILNLTRCSPLRRVVRRLPDVDGDKPAKKKFKQYPMTKANHPRTNGQIKRMNRSVKNATVKRYYYETRQRLKEQLKLFPAAYNFAKRLKTLNGLTPRRYVIKCRQNDKERFKLNPNRDTLGLNN